MTKLKFWLIWSPAKKTFLSLTWTYSQFSNLCLLYVTYQNRKWLLLGLLMAFCTWLHLLAINQVPSDSSFLKKKKTWQLFNFSASQFAFFESHFAAGIMKRVSQIAYCLIYTAKTQINLCVNITIEVVYTDLFILAARLIMPFTTIYFIKINYRPSENMAVQQVKQWNIWELRWAFELGTKLGTLNFKLF